MRVLRALVLPAAALSPLAAANITLGEKTCITVFGTLPVAHVPTRTNQETISLTLESTRTTYPLTTVTPTSTVTVQSILISTITLSQITDTITSTVLSTSTSTFVVNISQTDTVVVTSTITLPPTVTASTAANFTPFASEAGVIAAGGGTAKRKKRSGSPRLQRGGLDDLAERGVLSKTKKNLSNARYPQRVKCVVFVEEIFTRTTTVTALSTKTRTAAASIATSTSTETITSTVVPGDASTTLITTSTVTSVSVSVNIGVTTVTSTSTSTTLAGPAVTYYPQCQSDNLISLVGGQPLYNLQYTGPSFLAVPDAVTCCQLCANTPGCSGFSGPTPPYTDCYYFGDGGTCDASMPDWTVFLANGQTADFDTVGNGNCGQGRFGGSY